MTNGQLRGVNMASGRLPFKERAVNGLDTCRIHRFSLSDGSGGHARCKSLCKNHSESYIISPTPTRPSPRHLAHIDVPIDVKGESSCLQIHGGPTNASLQWFCISISSRSTRHPRTSCPKPKDIHLVQKCCRNWTVIFAWRYNTGKKYDREKELGSLRRTTASQLFNEIRVVIPHFSSIDWSFNPFSCVCVCVQEQTTHTHTHTLQWCRGVLGCTQLRPCPRWAEEVTCPQCDVTLTPKHPAAASEGPE